MRCVENDLGGQGHVSANKERAICSWTRNGMPCVSRFNFDYSMIETLSDRDCDLAEPRLRLGELSHVLRLLLADLLLSRYASRDNANRCMLS